ncbi:carboxymuconolactone decarboxylase family protein [Novosphingobium sp. JCM 18896]|uniref:carboxymuconolactone decarboxylase family protein n=1 Tax=Novosphingobium sp. JCM 18896 TaxID=2989731 RepID=UPI002223A09C|nr:carboxymuconolactone decarboxylase family protein [Novosphingobium sp. JCM 18896]MCW1428672.1 carboxymuconolactone decarboxylase family protein [Novosphingobium sp. JCM 18896]
MNENFEKGIKVFEEVYGPEQAQGLRDHVEGGEGFGVLQAQWSMEWPFGQVWTREEQMARRDRSLAVLGMMIGLRSFEEIRYHTKMGLANGLTRQEIEEVFYSALPYCGFPIANTAKAAMLAAFKDLDEAAAK